MFYITQRHREAESAESVGVWGGAPAESKDRVLGGLRVTPHSVGRCREATEGTGCSAALDPQAFVKA